MKILPQDFLNLGRRMRTIGNDNVDELDVGVVNPSSFRLHPCFSRRKSGNLSAASISARTASGRRS